jgi:hypothetical protein
VLHPRVPAVRSNESDEPQEPELMPQAVDKVLTILEIDFTFDFYTARHIKED